MLIQMQVLTNMTGLHVHPRYRDMLTQLPLDRDQEVLAQLHVAQKLSTAPVGMFSLSQQTFLPSFESPKMAKRTARGREMGCFSDLACV